MSGGPRGLVGYAVVSQSGAPFTSANTLGLQGSGEGSAPIVHGMLGSATAGELWDL